MTVTTLVSEAAMMTHEVDHLGIVVPDLDAAAAFYREVLRCAVSEPMVPPDQGIAIVFVPFGNLRIELIAPTVDRSPIAHVLEDHTVNDFLKRQPPAFSPVEELLYRSGVSAAGGCGYECWR